jgi:hypothetical protein
VTPTTTGSPVVSTPPLRLLLQAAPPTIDRNGMVLVDGISGVGKTTAVDQLLARVTRAVTLLTLDTGSGEKEVVAQLYYAVTGERPPRSARRSDMLLDLKQALAGQDRLIVIDEAQNGSIKGLEQLRTLHMDPSAHWALLLAGTGLDVALTRRAPALRSRVETVVPFPALDHATLPGVLANISPVWAATPQDLLLAADSACAHGVLRTWSHLLAHIPPGRTAATKRDLELSIQLVTGRPVSL